MKKEQVNEMLADLLQHSKELKSSLTNLKFNLSILNRNTTNFQSQVNASAREFEYLHEETERVMHIIPHSLGQTGS